MVNQELFDRLWEQSKGHTVKKVWPSGELLIICAGMFGLDHTRIHPLLAMQMQAYCENYPFTMLLNQ